MRLTHIRLHEVTRKFGRHVALRGANLTFEAGTLVMLLGPNGAGKTTLLRIISSLLRPSRGRVTATLAGQRGDYDVDYFELAAAHRGLVGLVSHSSLIYHDLTGLENLLLFADLYGLDAEVGARRSRALLDELDLTHAAGRRVAEYSRGMRQRLSIARALIQSPALVLLDEPFTGLDQQGKRILHNVLRRLRAEGCLVLMITHDLDQPSDLIDRALLLNQGRVMADGEPGQQGLSSWYEGLLAGQEVHP